MKKIVLSFVMAGAIFNMARAQEQPKVAKLSFKEAVKIGLENNVTLKQQKNQLDYTQVNKTAMMLQLGPSVQGNGSAYRNDGNSFNQNKGEVVNGVIDFVNGSVSASIPVFNGFRVVNQFKQANSANEAQLHQVNRSNQDVIRDVSNQYLTCLLDQELIKIDLENVQTQTTQRDQIKAQADLGSKAEADVFNQEYQLKNAELLLVRSRNKLKNDLATLALTLQIDPSLYFEVENVEWDINSLVADSTALDQMYSTAMGRRSDLKQAEFAERAAHYGYSAQKGNYYPSIYAGASYGSRYNYIHGEDNRSFNEQFRQDNTMLSYGLNVTIPIFNGFLYRSQTALQKVSYENAKVRHKNAEVTVKSDVLRAYQNFSDAKTNYESSGAQLRAAEMSYNMEKERYDLGISNIVQFTTANQAYVKAQGDFQNAKFTLMFQRLLINYAMGTLQQEDIP
ncbi:TolC family protein [Chryseolinea lacunae]|uniref:TolC family protein n=1 Tax=Chryseolinea lacunae TaxID=2801331 RepID=A0ABS1KK22_9BACT|nr:TolC family protein [Chryseolinea lacunae]MBL0739587.1 TolC family protein [Chryseolinea lacunae]